MWTYLSSVFLASVVCSVWTYNGWAFLMYGPTMGGHFSICFMFQAACCWGPIYIHWSSMGGPNMVRHFQSPFHACVASLGVILEVGVAWTDSVWTKVVGFAEQFEQNLKGKVPLHFLYLSVSLRCLTFGLFANGRVPICSKIINLQMCYIPTAGCSPGGVCLTTKMVHTLIAMGSAALAAAVPYPAKATQIFCKG